MKITLIGYGTRGDVQPFLGLAWELQRRGHAVRLLAPLNMRAWVERAGVPFAAIPVDVQALMAADEAQHMLARGDIRSFFAWLAGIEKSYLLGMRAAVVEATADADAIVTHTLMEDRAAAVGAARRVPVLPVYFFPLLPSSAFPSPFISTRGLGPLNRLTHKLLLDMLWKSSRNDVDAMRAELGAAPARDSYTRAVQRTGAPCVLAYSAEVFATPPDYGPNNAVTGGIAMPAELRAKVGEAGLPEGLRAWIDRGDAPVFLGFGSMPVLDVPRMVAMLRGALARVGRRAVLGAGWSAVPEGGDDLLYALPAVDHDALLPRCAAAAHHGGSGTTHASLRAGCPTLVCSVFADQPFWGARVRRLGVGDTVPFAKLSEDRLARGLAASLTEPVRAAARALGERMRAEDGLAHAVRIIEEKLPGAPRPA